MRFDDEDLTRDGFLGGAVTVFQPRSGYRAATDPVLLAAATPTYTGDSVLELGCGAGVASLCLAARVPGISLTGIEIQPAYAALATRNATVNNVDFEVVVADIEALPKSLTSRSFDQVIANPPYLETGEGTPATDDGKEVAFREATSLAIWMDVAIRRVKPKGYLTVIQNAERLPDLLAALDGRVGGIEVKPLAARAGRVAGRVLVRVRKGGRQKFKLHAPLILHRGEKHLQDRDDYTDEVRAILRDRAALTFS